MGGTLDRQISTRNNKSNLDIWLRRKLDFYKNLVGVYLFMYGTV